MVVKTTFRFPWLVEIPIDLDANPLVTDCIKLAEQVNEWLDKSLDSNHWDVVPRHHDGNPANNRYDPDAAEHILINWIRLHIHFYVKTEEDVMLVRLKWG